MPSYRAPVEEYRFIFDEFLAIDSVAGLRGREEIGPDIRSHILDEVGKMCEREVFPLNRSGDLEGCRLVNGQVVTPRGFKEAYDKLMEGGWAGLSFEPAWGGQGMPELISIPFDEMLASANMGFSGYIDITKAACALLQIQGSEAQKNLYLPRLVSGEWAAAMHLTEPQAGTDLGLIRTRAEPQPDGTYRLHGTKIFITGGDHDLTPNIISLVLARLPDAPEGSRGISLFLVPKFLVDDDGGLGARNGINARRVEHKMGNNSSATCEMVHEASVGYLVGLPHQGLRAMFIMMNENRLGVAIQGLAISEIAYQNALAYAQMRVQGRAPDSKGGADTIIRHPDVRRMLAIVKSFNDGARALTLWTGLQIDLARHSPDAAEREAADDLVALLTPVLKSYLTDGGTDNANLALQCLGGHGYIVDNGLEQYVRDVRITQIYEGTNGIQALDLLNRKLKLHQGRLPARFFALVEERLQRASTIPELAPFAEPLGHAYRELRDATDWVLQPGNNLDALAGATDYLRLFALVAMGWVWTGIARTSLDALKVNPANADFYRDKLAIGRFFMSRVPSETAMLASRCRLGNRLLADFPI